MKSAKEIKYFAFKPQGSIAFLALSTKSKALFFDSSIPSNLGYVVLSAKRSLPAVLPSCPEAAKNFVDATQVNYSQDS